MIFQIQRIYTKNAPHGFQPDWQPEVTLDLGTASTNLAEDVYEVVLLNLTPVNFDALFMNYLHQLASAGAE